MFEINLIMRIWAVLINLVDSDRMSIELIGVRDIAHGVHSITFDNGGEFADHERIAKDLGCKTYFARPYRSCDRGTNEHVNGQLRKVYPKGKSLREVDSFYLQVNVEHLNSIPREILKFDSPQRLFEQELGALKIPPPG